MLVDGVEVGTNRSDHAALDRLQSPDPISPKRPGAARLGSIHLPPLAIEHCTHRNAESGRVFCSDSFRRVCTANTPCWQSLPAVYGVPNADSKAVNFLMHLVM